MFQILIPKLLLILDTQSSLLDRIPKIRDLTLQGWTHSWSSLPAFSCLEELQVLDISDTTVPEFPLLPNSLQKLVMRNCSNYSFSSNESQTNIQQNKLVHLTSLIVGGVYALGQDALPTLLKPNKGNLEELHVPNGWLFETREIMSLAELGFFKNLVSLDLGGTEIDDRNMETLIAQLPCLRYMALENNHITGVGVKAIVLKPESKMEHLVLNHCDHVSSDAIEYARAKGIIVDFNFPDLSRGSKRLRLMH